MRKKHNDYKNLLIKIMNISDEQAWTGNMHNLFSCLEMNGCERCMIYYQVDSPTPTAAGSELRDDSTSRLSNSKHSLSIPIDV